MKTGELTQTSNPLYNGSKRYLISIPPSHKTELLLQVHVTLHEEFKNARVLVS